MKAFLIQDAGKTGFKEIAKPKLAPGEVLLKVDYVGYCGSDLNTFRGNNPLAIEGRIPGHEISATITEIAECVPEAWEVGQRVTCSPYTNCGFCTSCMANRTNCCENNETMGVQRDGAMTSYIKVPWTKLFNGNGIKPEHVALVEPLTVGGHAADRSQANEDTIGCVIGCGAIGLGAILGLANKNCRKVVAVDVDDEKLALARDFGATDVINSKTQNHHKELVKLAEGNGPHVIIEAV
ncbi:MAG: alcohol dehydrogenase catalytic domain-containing protein, partial [Eggerthellaceae bacterium]|nr:alcohol dehydrogenase catalytic domain-containing protein [Eggerthellaceae bacterium]